MTPNERFETFGSTPEIRESRSYDILRHSLMRRNMSIMPALARSSRRGDSKEGSSSPSLVGFGTVSYAITAREKPKHSQSFFKSRPLPRLRHKKRDTSQCPSQTFAIKNRYRRLPKIRNNIRNRLMKSRYNVSAPTMEYLRKLSRSSADNCAPMFFSFCVS